ncbi:MAG: hypothetical protein IT580_17150 [Verrucomicrobiales bacterium]|nr:hypothetical protein [Verrucomicrobiales bacterium]
MTELSQPLPESSAAEDQASTARRPVRSRWARRLWTVPWKWTVGALLTQTLLGAVLVFGWLQRWTCRTAVKTWWRHAGRPGRTLALGLAPDPALAAHVHAPDWFRALPAGTMGAADGGTSRRWLGSLRANFRTGWQGLLNTLALTLPAGVLMQLGWWGGWQNSFHKGYEQFLVGPAVSWLGIMLFVGAMFYLPLALARQAVTGQWREFWRWSTTWTLVRHAWAGCAALAVLGAFLNVGAMALKTWPAFLPQARTSERIQELVKAGLDPAAAAQSLTFPPGAPDWNQLTEAEARAILDRHFVFAGFVVFGSLLVWRGLAGRVYASAVVRAVQRGALGEEQLSEREWRTLAGFGLLRTREARPRWWPVRLAAWAASRTGRLACAVTVFLGWFLFVGVAYVGEFLAFHPIIGFLNQPLVQIPWFRYVPAHLQDPAPALWLTVLVLVGVLCFSRLSRWFRARRGTPRLAPET